MLHDMNSSRLISAVWGGFGVLAIIGLVTPNPWMTACAMLIPPIIFWLLWRPGEPPVLAFAAAFQWLQATCPVLAADIEWRALTDQPFGAYMQRAAWLSLISVTVLAIGMSTPLRRMPTINRDAVRSFSRELSSERLFVAYLVSLLMSTAFIWISMRAGGLRQPILALSSIKWVPLFLLCWSTLQCRKPRRWMTVAIGIELVIGFSGFFSSFKSVLFLLLIVTGGTASDRQRLPKAELGVVCVITLLLVAYWQAVKVDYRNYLNQGTGQQVVLVSFEQRMKYLAKSFTKVTPTKMAHGMIDGVKRLGYITYCAHALRTVPKSIPHQNGGLWLGAVKHVFMPRILFPDKPTLNDSERTTYFTGLRVAGARQGTSISIGYIGESYIDFGKRLMLIPIFMLGWLYGWIYRLFVCRDPGHLIGFAVATSILLFSAVMLETSNIKIVGGLATAVIAFGLLLVVAREWFLQKVLHR
jgi:hypothetical protein